MEIDITEILAQNLKELRIERNLTQSEIAKVLKVSRVVYNRYENNQRVMPIELLGVIADFYNVSVDYLLGRED